MNQPTLGGRCCAQTSPHVAKTSGPRRFPSIMVLAGATALIALTGTAQAGVVPFSTVFSRDYLLIGMGPVNTTGGRPGVGDAVKVNNFELGANKAPVPAPSSFGPGLLGNVPNIPLNARPVASGIFNNGNIAITHPGGRFNLQNVGVYGDLGVRTAGALPGSNSGVQNSFFNDPNHFPNTFTPTGFTNPGVHKNTGGTGSVVNPGSANQATRMDSPNHAGITGNFNHSGLVAELASARTAINGLSPTGTLNVSGTGGTLSTHTTITLGPGLNVIDIVTGGGDFKLQNANLVIDGPANSGVIFRVPHHAKFLVANANILLGLSGISGGSVLFFTDRPDNAEHFSFSNAVIDGASFWTLGESGGQISMSNVQGCTQLIGDKINSINDVRLGRCSFDTTFIPTPGAVAMLGLGGLLVARRRR